MPAPPQGMSDPRIKSRRVQTTNATPTPIVNRMVPGGTALLITVYVTGRKQLAGPARAAYIRNALVHRAPAGSATMQGPVNTVFTRESDSAWDCTIDVTGNNWRCMVTGAAAATIDWHCRFEIVRAP